MVLSNKKILNFKPIYWGKVETISGMKYLSGIWKLTGTMIV